MWKFSVTFWNQTRRFAQLMFHIMTLISPGPHLTTGMWQGLIRNTPLNSVLSGLNVTGQSFDRFHLTFSMFVEIVGKEISLAYGLGRFVRMSGIWFISIKNNTIQSIEPRDKPFSPGRKHDLREFIATYCFMSDK